MARARTIGSERGFTLVEVMVAMMILLVGVLGTVTMVDGANSVTTQTKAREGATALARSVLEIARGVPYRELTGARILAELEVEARPGLGDADSGASGHQVESRNFTYTVTPTVCSVDDAKDGLGDHDEPAVTFCPESSAIGDEDRNPDDYRRMTVRLDWIPQGGQTGSLTQRGLVTNPVGGVGPSVTSLDPDAPDSDTIVTDIGEATYDVRTSTIADTVSWSINGARIGDAEGADTAWRFKWELGPTNTPAYVDCTYLLQAEAFDEKGRAGTPNALTVTLNRRQPFGPPNFAGGRNLNGAFVDIQWNNNPECDVEEYRVYRGTATMPIDEPVCTRSRNEPTWCVDEEAPSGETLFYEVVAVDRWPSGAQRTGDRSNAIEVEALGDADDNAAPTFAGPVSVCTGDGETTACSDINGNPAPDGTAVLSWPEASDDDGIRFYRVYRVDGEVTGQPSYDARLDVLYEVPAKSPVFVDSTATGPHTYWVTAVDQRFGESEPVGPLVWP